jgi:serine/threonine-protein kinase
MDPSDAFARADAVFDAALDLPPNERAAFLARECGDDTALRTAVDRLLAAHDQSNDFLGAPAAAFAGPLFSSVSSDPLVPERVGPYRIVRELGHGGMGTVYLAERDDGQFRQRVALKLVNGALAGGWVVERFLAERRILASLEHPRVARLFDGGTAPDGTPWFAMEYVEGEPLDAYCHSHALSLAQRLRIFRDVCALPSLARAQEATGDARGAIDSYERYLSTPYYWRYETDAVEMSRVLRHLAELRAANRDSVGAANARARLAELWRKADPQLRSTLGDAK